MKKFLTESEVAEMTSLAVQTLRNWRSARKGPSYVKLGARSVRYDAAEVERFMTSNRVETDGTMA